MEDQQRQELLIAMARQKHRQIQSLLRKQLSRHGYPLPDTLLESPLLVRLGREIVQIEYDLYRLAPDLTAEELYPDPFYLDDYFC